MAKSKKDNKKNRERRLLLLILLLMFTLSLGGLVTFAWFTSNRVVGVEDLQVNVTAVNGLEISADAINWSTRITKDDLIDNENQNTNQLPSILTNVSSVGEVVDGQMNLYYGSVTECADDDVNCQGDGYYLSALGANTEKACHDYRSDGTAGSSKCASDVYLMAFDLYLKLDGEYETAVPLSLTAKAGVTAVGRNNGIQNTARVAFVEEGYLTKYEYLDGSTDVDGIVIPGYDTIAKKKEGTKAIIWEPNSDAHTEKGRINAEKYGIAIAGQSKLNYKGIKTTIPANTVPLYHTDEFNEYFDTPQNVISSLSTNSSTIDTTIRLRTGVTKFRVYFWVEGQDVDTENYAAGSDMKLTLEFSIPEAG